MPLKGSYSQYTSKYGPYNLLFGFMFMNHPEKYQHTLTSGPFAVLHSSYSEKQIKYMNDSTEQL